MPYMHIVDVSSSSDLGFYQNIWLHGAHDRTRCRDGFFLLPHGTRKIDPWRGDSFMARCHVCHAVSASAEWWSRPEPN